MASNPDDFLDERIAFRFGSGQTATREIDWFSPTMRGTVANSSEIGFTSLNGLYSLEAGPSEAESFEAWAKSELKADAVISAKTPVVLLTYALLTVGAWVPMSAAILLLGATIMSWYVLRAHGRELRILAGMRLSTIVLTDLRSLFGALALPAAATFLLAVLVVLVSGFGRVSFYISTLAVFSAVVAAFALAVALLMGVFTLPAVRDIAARRPSERGAWVLSEILKAAAIVIVAAILPTVSGVVANASAATAQGVIWESMGDSVTIRIGSAQLGEAEDAAFVGLTRDMFKQDAAMFSMSLISKSVNVVPPEAASTLKTMGFDSLVLTSERFLNTVNKKSGATWEPVRSIETVDELPASVRQQLVPNLELWTQSGKIPELHLYKSTGQPAIAVLGGMSGTLDTYQRPLILSMNDINQFNDSFLTSAISRGNIVFTGPSYLSVVG